MKFILALLASIACLAVSLFALGRQVPLTGAGKGGFGSATIPADWLMDNNGNTDGVQPASGANAPISHGLTPSSIVYNDGTGMVYSNGTQPVLLPFPLLISSTTYTGNGGIGLFGTTNGVGGHVGDVEVRFTGQTSPVSFGFTMQTDCGPPSTFIECGTIMAGANSAESVYAAMKIATSGDTTPQFALETDQGLSTQRYAYAINTIYNVNIQWVKGPSATQQMKVCDANGNYLQNFTEVGGAATTNFQKIRNGWYGQESSVPSGKHLRIYNVRLISAGTFSSSGTCF